MKHFLASTLLAIGVFAFAAAVTSCGSSSSQAARESLQNQPAGTGDGYYSETAAYPSADRPENCAS